MFLSRKTKQLSATLRDAGEFRTYLTRAQRVKNNDHKIRLMNHKIRQIII